MASELYALLTGAANLFQLPINPGPNAIYDCPVSTGQQPDLTPLTRTEQATVDTTFNCQKHYFDISRLERYCTDVLLAHLTKVRR
jgi:hypothetical protein